jgi:signal transduction histidine kinase
VSLKIDEHKVVISITSSGRSIAPDQLEQIFDLFVQLLSGGATSVGLGIGPASVRQLLLLRLGTMIAASDGPGAGITFCVRLPAQQRLHAGTPPSHEATNLGAVAFAIINEVKQPCSGRIHAE